MTQCKVIPFKKKAKEESDIIDYSGDSMGEEDYTFIITRCGGNASLRIETQDVTNEDLTVSSAIDIIVQLSALIIRISSPGISEEDILVKISKSWDWKALSS